MRANRFFLGKARLRWGRGLSVLVSALLIMAAGCAPGLNARPALPTAIPGVLSNSVQGKANTPSGTSGPTSTPAPFATRLPPTPPPPPRAVPHDLVNKGDCMFCHKGKTYYAVPADHRNRTSRTCLGCHAAPPTNPPAMPHAEAGREACLSCHLTGVNNAPPIPRSHAGSSNETCGGCHRSK